MIWDDPKVKQAYDFAKHAHAGQKRKNGRDYFEDHLFPVARSVEGCLRVASEPAVDLTCAALLHDTVEDCGVTLETLSEKFGDEVSRLVDGVTNVPGENRKERVAKTQWKLIDAEVKVRFLKCFDIRHNAKDMVIVDPNFGRIWYQEQIDLITAENGKFLVGIPPVVWEPLEIILDLGLRLSYSAKK